MSTFLFQVWFTSGSGIRKIEHCFVKWLQAFECSYIAFPFHIACSTSLPFRNSSFASLVATSISIPRRLPVVLKKLDRLVSYWSEKYDSDAMVSSSDTMRSVGSSSSEHSSTFYNFQRPTRRRSSATDFWCAYANVPSEII